MSSAQSDNQQMEVVQRFQQQHRSMRNTGVHHHGLSTGEATTQQVEDAVSRAATRPQEKTTPTIHTQRTLLNTNNTTKNWRSLVTPANDSFKKLEMKRRPGAQYSQSTLDNGNQFDAPPDTTS